MKPKILLSVNGLKENYINAVNSSGATAIFGYCPEYSEEYDGLIICGGNDIAPSYYGEEINGSVDIDAKRDSSEFALVEAFMKHNKPIMGICRGYQLLNIAFGGSLYQDISNAKEHSSDKGDLVHKVYADKGNYLCDMYGTEFFVNSHHHQAIKDVADVFDVAAYADNGTIEAIVHKNLPVFGVQWHPERMCFEKKRADTVDGAELFRFFVDVCKKDKNN